MSLFAVALIIVIILVVGPILYWIFRGLYKSVRRMGEELEHVPPDSCLGLALIRP